MIERKDVFEKDLIAGEYYHPVKFDCTGKTIRLDFAYNAVIVKEVKNMEGAKFDPKNKSWTIKRSPRNEFVYRYLIGEKVFEKFDAEIVPIESDRPLYEHQKEMLGFIMPRRQGVLAAEMGCVDGDASVYVRRGAGGFKTTLNKLFDRFHDRSRKTRPVFKIRSFDGFVIFNNIIKDVLYKGKREVFEILTNQGRSLKVTEDHEICIGKDKFIRLDRLKIGDMVVCGEDHTSFVSEEEIVSIKPAGKTVVYDIVCEDPHRNFVANGIIVHNCGKTLVAIEVMERSGFEDWWWIGPKSALRAVNIIFEEWKSGIIPKMMTYEGLKKLAQNWEGNPPRGIVFDESSRIKNNVTDRSKAAMHVVNQMRKEYGEEYFSILMSGSPAPQSPVDWWHQLEVACPGFMMESTPQKLNRRLGITLPELGSDGNMFPRFITWRNDPKKCDKCGLTKEIHTADLFDDDEIHPFKSSVDEVSKLYRRMKGLVFVKFKKDCLDLPEKIYEEIQLEPTEETINIATTLVETANSSMDALVLLRELSDGFYYDYDDNGKRITKQIKTPKEGALVDILEDHDDHRRIIIFAGFHGSIDRVTDICTRNKWKVIQVDGRGPWRSEVASSEEEMLKAFQDTEKYGDKIAFVGHPASGGMGLTLTASPSIVYYSNDYSAENRIQSEDRIHRPGCKGAKIIDLLHLPTDRRVVSRLKEKRGIQAITLGDIKKDYL